MCAVAALVFPGGLLLLTAPIAHGECTAVLHYFSARDRFGRQRQTYEGDGHRDKALLAPLDWLCRVVASAEAWLKAEQNVAGAAPRVLRRERILEVWALWKDR